MKIRLERDDTTLEFERAPMPESRFRALCILLATVVYAGMVVLTAWLCGLLGVLVIGTVTVLTALVVAGLNI